MGAEQMQSINVVELLMTIKSDISSIKTDIANIKDIPCLSQSSSTFIPILLTSCSQPVFRSFC